MTTPRPDSSSYRPRVLVVCRANQCRSPLAEFLLRRAATTGDVNLEVSSAGSAAVDGRPMHPLAQSTLLRRGIVAADWTSHQLTPDLLAAADLILAVDSAELSNVGYTLPACTTRSFTLLQFARLATVMSPLSGSSSDRFAAALHEATAHARSRVTPPKSVDIADPIGKGRRAFERCALVIDTALADVVHAFPPAAAADHRSPRSV
jgi:protein-tyrosine phosphatase